MNALTRAVFSSLDLLRLKQAFKWTVYALLFVNFGFYIQEDWYRAVRTLTAQSGFLQWAGSFATTIDESAWLLLLLMFELETYALEDDAWKNWVAKTIRGIRLVCYLLILHTVYAYAGTVIAYSATVPVDGIADLCDLAGSETSFVYNLKYTVIDAESCTRLPDAEEYFSLGKYPLVTTSAGLALARDLAWADLVEIVTWLLIIGAVETIVRLQDRGIATGKLRSAASTVTLAGYAVLCLLAVYWPSLSHWLYTWDTFLWTAGFVAIEMNVSEWRAELLDADRRKAGEPVV